MDPSRRNEIFLLKNTYIAYKVNQNSPENYATLHFWLDKKTLMLLKS